MFERAILSFSVHMTEDGRIAAVEYGPHAGVFPSSGGTDGTPAGAPHPGTEAALRRYIAEVQEGSPNYAQMSPGLASALRQQLPHMQAMFLSWGALHSVEFTGNSPLGWDGFDVTFDRANASFSIILAADGTIEGHWCLSYREISPAAQP